MSDDALFQTPTPIRPSGFASPAAAEREAPLSLDKHLIPHPASTFLLRAQDHWPEYGIRSGDVLIVDRAWEPRNNLVALGIRDEQFCLGRLRQHLSSWQLLSQTHTKTQHQPAAEAADEIWGVVLYAIRTFPH